uniref:Ig-like domain-containing protein n=1 Tax=Xiphophorus maculatus TaxID=8083 RepID=A0A3B5QNY5_XIPMA
MYNFWLFYFYLQTLGIIPTPFNILAKRGEAARISCSHNIQNYDVILCIQTSNQILWYKQTGHQMQLLGYTTGTSPLPEKGLNVEMAGSADANQNCTLIIKELNVSSSAVYFCAASQHSAAVHCCSVQKPNISGSVISIGAHLILRERGAILFILKFIQMFSILMKSLIKESFSQRSGPSDSGRDVPQTRPGRRYQLFTQY